MKNSFNRKESSTLKNILLVIHPLVLVMYIIHKQDTVAKFVTNIEQKRRFRYRELTATSALVNKVGKSTPH